MKVFLIITFYLSIGVGTNLFFMWLDARRPDLEIGEIPNGSTFMILAIGWPVVLISMIFSLFSDTLNRIIHKITARMKEDAKK